jgi:hypothetical protein
MNPEKLKKLQAQAELVRIGGKGMKSCLNTSNKTRNSPKIQINISRGEFSFSSPKFE